MNVWPYHFERDRLSWDNSRQNHVSEDTWYGFACTRHCGKGVVFCNRSFEGLSEPKTGEWSRAAIDLGTKAYCGRIGLERPYLVSRARILSAIS